MDIFNPNESVGFHCSITYRSFARALEGRLHKTGVTPAQFFALAHLMAIGTMPQSELAAHLSTTPVTVVKLIDRMERDGWVERRLSAEDRRVKLIVPTSQAKAIWNELTVHARAIVKQAHAGISKKEIEIVKKTLSKIRKNLEK